MLLATWDMVLVEWVKLCYIMRECVVLIGRSKYLRHVELFDVHLLLNHRDVAAVRQTQAHRGLATTHASTTDGGP